ncbi:hypothetical protein RHS03_06208, partial [Rhizoctonia solani]
MSQDNNAIEAPTQAERDTFANTYIVGLHFTGPQKSWERSGTRYCWRAFRSVWYDARKCSWSAPKCSPSNPDPLDPNEETLKTGALQIAPGFLGPP